MQWQIIEDGALRFRCWDEEFVVYNAFSGDTHILAAPAAELLLMLQGAPLETLSLARMLAEQWQCDVSPDFLGELEMMLSDMQVLSLVKRIRP
jgi:PqqD family protein of HPr-rel-A system